MIYFAWVLLVSAIAQIIKVNNVGIYFFDDYTLIKNKYFLALYLDSTVYIWNSGSVGLDLKGIGKQTVLRITGQENQRIMDSHCYSVSS